MTNRIPTPGTRTTTIPTRATPMRATRTGTRVTATRRHRSAAPSQSEQPSTSASSLLEATYGIIGQSTALLADAGHNLADVLGLLAAWAAAHVSGRTPTERFTWGMRQAAVLVALRQTPCCSSSAPGQSAGRRSNDFAIRPPVAGGTVMAVAAVGIVVNGATALMFARGQERTT